MKTKGHNYRKYVVKGSSSDLLDMGLKQCGHCGKVREVVSNDVLACWPCWHTLPFEKRQRLDRFRWILIDGISKEETNDGRKENRGKN